MQLDEIKLRVKKGWRKNKQRQIETQKERQIEIQTETERQTVAGS